MSRLMVDLNKPLKAQIFDADELLDSTTSLVVDVQVVVLPHSPYTNAVEIIYNGGRSSAFELLPQD